MDVLLSRARGDVDEFRRVSRFVRKYMDADAYMYACQPTVSELLDSFAVGPAVTELPWHGAKTKKKRKRLLDACCDLPNASSFGHDACPPEYVVALYEDELNEIYDIAASIIQRHARGVITRTKTGVHNPHCDVGRSFLRSQFENMT